MGKQLGILPISATMDNMTFYKTKDGMKVKKQSKISKDAIMNGDSFVRTRENFSDFGTAGKAGQLVRLAFRSIINACKDHRVVSRLQTLMVKVVKADAVNLRGKRNVVDGELEKLVGFDFNRKATLATVLNTDLTVAFDRVNGNVDITVPSFIPVKKLVKPQDATHYKVVSAASALDFVNGKFISKDFESGYLPLDNNPTAEIDIVHQLPANGTDPMIAVLGIQFFMVEHGVQYELKTHEFNALSIVNVSTV